MNIKMLKNDFKRNRAGNVSLLLFMTLAACLVVVATIVVTQLITSMIGMYNTAKPPHFLQMHKGEVNLKAIDEFNSSYDGVTAWQTLAMVDVYGDDIKVYGDDEFSLSDCRLDISLVKQNKEYDLLLDENRNVINVNKGEIGIPVILLDSYNINLGDTIVLTSNSITKEFKVTAFVHDAQMNSTLCSSTRMLISDRDFEELFGNVGENEYLIEVYFTDSSMASDFKSAYEKAGLPQDGQAVTYTVIFLLSAFRDIAMAMVLIFVSMLLVIVALMCIKYTVMAALEEEIGEIGTMKAIGMSYKDIRNLYLVKYKMMVTAGIVIGYVLALIMSNVFTGHVSSTFGKQPVSILTIGLPVAVCALVYFITNHYCKKILKKLKKVTVVDALVREKGFGKKQRVKDGLHKSKTMSVNLLVSIRETLNNFGGFVIVFVVMFIVSGIIIVPINLLNTMKSKDFISYMGSSMDDILIEIDSGENLENKYEVIKVLLNEDVDIEKYKEFRRVRVETINSEDEWMNLHVDCGNYAGKELKYLDGKAPLMENEIALSKLNADEMGKNTGDMIIIRFNHMQKEFVISGIYQDVTSGGYTAKAIYSFAGVDTQKYQFTINITDGVDAAEKASQWSDKIGGGYDIEPMEEFISQTLGGVSRQVEVATTAVVVIGMLLAALIVVLFMKLRLAKDVAQIAAMKAIGFTNSDVRKQYLYKIGMVSIAGIFAGTLISNILGESIVSVTFGMMGLGISKITFIINPWIAFVILPLVIFVVVAGMIWISTKQIREYNIISLINE
ncbi:ABC transporter permease [Sedimentibacter sp. zth1]|uniref:ABC transporter permease n=1 Tax=Sedimentibacter sp. zth1 TaxID=2816908 RepID=UPI001A929B29|nr:FtsX-like permease family protein [Sedimentibacter sp. zth1]QSX07403.1 ABC transporter permease [Sedimentibacter sp. zth1]